MALVAAATLLLVRGLTEGGEEGLPSLSRAITADAAAAAEGGTHADTDTDGSSGYSGSGAGGREPPQRASLLAAASPSVIPFPRAAADTMAVEACGSTTGGLHGGGGVSATVSSSRDARNAGITAGGSSDSGALVRRHAFSATAAVSWNAHCSSGRVSSYKPCGIGDRTGGTAEAEEDGWGARTSGLESRESSRGRHGLR